MVGHITIGIPGETHIGGIAFGEMVTGETIHTGIHTIIIGPGIIDFTITTGIIDFGTITEYIEVIDMEIGQPITMLIAEEI